MQVATIWVWSDALSGRDCSIQVREDACDVELHAVDQRVFTVTCPSIVNALAAADEMRPPYLQRRERPWFRKANALLTKIGAT